jgi:3-mercaptopropionate dioxygenase
MIATVLERPVGLQRVERFIDALDQATRSTADTATLLELGSGLLRDLVAHDDWLPDSHARPLEGGYAQHLLHRAPWDRFSVVSFVWGPGQSTPVHDHRVWGLVGVLRGAELVRDFVRDPEDGLVAAGPTRRLQTGAVDAIDPAQHDIHQVANAYDDRVSVSIHVYGADIGTVERATYDRFGQQKAFISGYTDTPALIA